MCQDGNGSSGTCGHRHLECRLILILPTCQFDAPSGCSCLRFTIFSKGACNFSQRCVAAFVSGNFVFPLTRAKLGPSIIVGWTAQGGTKKKQKPRISRARPVHPHRCTSTDKEWGSIPARNTKQNLICFSLHPRAVASVETRIQMAPSLYSSHICSLALLETPTEKCQTVVCK